MKYDLKKIAKWLYNLIVINTLDSIQKIDSLVEGIIVGTFGILIGAGGYYVFDYFGLIFSAAICKLAFLAYLAVVLYHFVGYEYKWLTRHRKAGNRSFSLFWLSTAVVLTLFVYLLLIEQALYIAELFPIAKLQFGSGLLFLRSLPGLILFVYPLVRWEKLCERTPVDELIRRIFKE